MGIKYLSSPMMANVVSLVLVGVASGLLPSPVQARPWEISLSFPEGTDRGAPPRTTGAGTRGNCVTNEALPLTPIMPKNNIGTTTQPNPSIFVYVPETKATEVEILLQDQNNQEIYSAVLPWSNDSGVIKFSLPETVQLEINQPYTWSFTLICETVVEGHSTYDRYSVDGIFERQPKTENLAQKLQQATSPLELAQAYAQAGIWVETLAILAQLYDSYPQEWSELLQSVELDQVAQVPLSPCYTLSQETPTPIDSE
jgi:hypothetical protein